MLNGIVYLRALAAMSVVFMHIFSYAKIHGINTYGFNYNFFAGGVDIFFVISGFLMVYTTKKYMLSSLDRLDFLLKRICRIAPLYCFITTLVFMAFLINPGVSQKSIDWLVYLRSMLFIPTSFDGETLVSTIISPGWTLCYEMFFYFIFALVMGVSYKKGLFFLIGFFVSLVLAKNLLNGYYWSFYTDPVILEFIYGVSLAFIPKAKRPLLIFLLGVVCLVLGYFYIKQRAYGMGIGAFLIVWSGVSLQTGSIANKFLTLVGDASYSIYLTHMYVIRGAFKIIGVPWISELFSLVCVIVLGLIVYNFFEKPVGEILRGKVDEFILNKRNKQQNLLSELG